MCYRFVSLPLMNADNTDTSASANPKFLLSVVLTFKFLSVCDEFSSVAGAAAVHKHYYFKNSRSFARFASFAAYLLFLRASVSPWFVWLRPASLGVSLESVSSVVGFRSFIV